jgi:hypothetical protein
MGNKALPETLSAVAILIIAALVLFAVVRLVLDHWTYVFLALAVAIAVFYVLRAMRTA